MDVTGLVEYLVELIGQIAFGSGNEGDLLVNQVQIPFEVGEAQVKQEQGIGRDGGQKIGPKALIVDLSVIGVPNPLR